MDTACCVGDLVVCVDTFGPAAKALLKEGHVYVVTDCTKPETIDSVMQMVGVAEALTLRRIPGEFCDWRFRTTG